MQTTLVVDWLNVFWLVVMITIGYFLGWMAYAGTLRQLGFELRWHKELKANRLHRVSKLQGDILEALPPTARGQDRK